MIKIIEFYQKAPRIVQFWLQKGGKNKLLQEAIVEREEETIGEREFRETTTNLH